MRVYGMELRRRVMDDYAKHKDDKKVTMKVLSEKWQVSVKWIVKLLRQLRETGSYAPIVAKVGRKRKLASHTDELTNIIKGDSDATLVEIQEKLPVQVSLTTIHRELRRLKISLKKNSCTLPNKTAKTLRQNERNGESSRRV